MNSCTDLEEIQMPILLIQHWIIPEFSIKIHIPFISEDYLDGAYHPGVQHSIPATGHTMCPYYQIHACRHAISLTSTIRSTFIIRWLYNHVEKNMNGHKPHLCPGVTFLLLQNISSKTIFSMSIHLPIPYTQQ